MVLQALVGVGEGCDGIRQDGELQKGLELIVVSAGECDAFRFGTLEVAEDIFGMGKMTLTRLFSRVLSKDIGNGGNVRASRRGEPVERANQLLEGGGEV